jgi:hypothetical protein
MEEKMNEKELEKANKLAGQMLEEGYVIEHGCIFKCNTKGEADLIRRDSATALLGRLIGRSVLIFK